MQNVPGRAHLIVATLSGVVVAETVHQAVPKWIEGLDEEAFTKRYPDIINHQIAALEILDAQIFGLPY